MSTTTEEPEGIKFTDEAGREMMLVEEGPHEGWLAKKHPDGQYVTVGEASRQDLANLSILLKREMDYHCNEGSPWRAGIRKKELQRVEERLEELREAA